MNVTQASEGVDDVLDAVSKAVIADREVLETVLLGLLSRGHVLLEDVPGTGKTLTARSVTTALGLEFSRIQFTPDLLPSDVMGTHVFNEKTREFEFQPGPVFGNVVLADEINRAPPKTQAALLEAMEEEQVTVGGETHDLPDPFFVLATQNPVEQEGSLHPDETVLADGRLWRAGDLRKHAREIGECIVDTGETRVYDVDVSTQTLTRDGDVTEQSALVYEIDYEGQVYSVRTKTGRSIEVTGNHPFLVNRNGRIQWTRADELRVDDALVTPERFDVQPSSFPEHEDVLSKLENEFRVVRRDTVRELTERAPDAELSPREWDAVRVASDCSKRDVSKRIDESYDRVLNFFDGTENGVGTAMAREWTDSDLIEADHLEAHEQTSLRRPPTVSEAGFVVGFVLSDGWAADSSVEIVQKNHPDAFDRWVSLCRDLGLTVRTRTHKGVRHAKVDSKPFVRYLEERYALDDPASLIDAPRAFLDEFLDIFLLAESNFDADRSRVTFVQKSEETMNVIAYLLHRYGIRPWLYEREDRFELRIQGTDIETFLENFTWPGREPEIPSDSPHRALPVNAQMVSALTDALGYGYAGDMAEREWYAAYSMLQGDRSRIQESSLSKLVADGGATLDSRSRGDIRERATENIQESAHECGVSLTEFVEGTGHTKHRLWQAYTGDREPPREAVESLADRYENTLDDARSTLGYLRKLVESDTFCDRIVDVQARDYKGPVVGLSVPETHNYVGGFGACGINHNTFPLPEAQLDRFVVKTSIGYPDDEGEVELLRRRAGRTAQSPSVQTVLDRDGVRDLRSAPEDVRVDDDLLEYISSVTRATREDARVQVGVSPRGTQRLFETARSRAVVRGRTFVTPEDVKRIARPVLAHRLVLTPDAAVQDVSKVDVIEEVLESVPVPTID